MYHFFSFFATVICSSTASQRHNNKDAVTKTDAGRLLYKNIYFHFIARVRKGCSRFACERELETEQNWNILTPKLWPAMLCLSRSPLDPNSIRAPESPFGRVWLSLTQLVSNWHSNSTQLSSSSVQFVGLILPSNSHAVIWTRLHASATSSDIWRSGCVTSAIFEMACVSVIELK